MTRPKFTEAIMSLAHRGPHIPAQDAMMRAHDDHQRNLPQDQYKQLIGQKGMFNITVNATDGLKAWVKLTNDEGELTTISLDDRNAKLEAIHLTILPTADESAPFEFSAVRNRSTHLWDITTQHKGEVKQTPNRAGISMPQMQGTLQKIEVIHARALGRAGGR